MKTPDVAAVERMVVAHSPLVVTSVHDTKTVHVEGGIIVPISPITSAADWCAYYGVPVHDGVAVLYKGVDRGRWWVSFRCSCYGTMHEQTTETWRAYLPRMTWRAHEGRTAVRATA